jgi:hypothetical protein
VFSVLATLRRHHAAGRISRRAFTGTIREAEKDLRGCVTLIGSFPKPLRGLGRIRPHAVAMVITEAEI